MADPLAGLLEEDESLDPLAGLLEEDSEEVFTNYPTGRGLAADVGNSGNDAFGRGLASTTVEMGLGGAATALASPLIAASGPFAPFTAGAAYTGGEFVGRTITDLLGLREDGQAGDYTSMNPLENPAILNIGLPVAGKAISAGAKGLGKVFKPMVAETERLSLGVERGARQKDLSHGYKVKSSPTGEYLHSYGIDEAIDFAKADGLFDKALTKPGLIKETKNKVGKLSSELTSLLDEADKIGTSPNISFDNVDEYISRVGSAKEADAIEIANDLKNKLLNSPASKSFKGLLGEKQAKYRFLNYEKAASPKDVLIEEIDKALARDIKESIERSYSALMKDSSKKALVEELNTAQSNYLTLQSVLERGASKDRDFFSLISSPLATMGAAARSTAVTGPRVAKKILSPMLPFAGTGIRGAFGDGNFNPQAIVNEPYPLGLPRETKAINPDFMHEFLEKAGNDPLAIGLAEGMNKAFRAGNITVMEAVHEQMTKAFPQIFQKGWGVNGRIRDEETRSQYKRLLGEMKAQGRIDDEFIASQVSAFYDKNSPGKILPIPPPKELSPVLGIPGSSWVEMNGVRQEPY